MGFNALPFLLWPIAIVIVGIALQAGAPNLQGSATVVFCDVNHPASSPCVPQNSPGTSYYCDPTSIAGFFQACKILPACSIHANYPAFCINDPLTAVAAGCLGAPFLTSYASCGTWLPAGQNVFIPTATIAANLSTGGALFGVSSTSGFITFVSVVIGLACLAGLNIFGSGESSEAVHDLLMGGLLLSVWGVLIGLEGFISPQPSQLEMFSQLNMMIAGFGTFLFGIATLSYCIGVGGAISRGS